MNKWYKPWKGLPMCVVGLPCMGAVEEGSAVCVSSGGAGSWAIAFLVARRCGLLGRDYCQYSARSAASPSQGDSAQRGSVRPSQVSAAIFNCILVAYTN